jgi:hypothetical protein
MHFDVLAGGGLDSVGCGMFMSVLCSDSNGRGRGRGLSLYNFLLSLSEGGNNYLADGVVNRVGVIMPGPKQHTIEANTARKVKSSSLVAEQELVSTQPPDRGEPLQVA